MAWRDSRSLCPNVKHSKWLAHLLLRWSCNARDVHLLRGCSERVVREAAARHDQGVKVAFACIVGALRPSAEGTLADVPDTMLSEGFLKSYAQACLGLKDGGMGLRLWAQHCDAAFLGQWALSLQSAHDKLNDRCFYPVLRTTLSAAVDAGGHVGRELPLPEDAGGTPLARDLARAWIRHTAKAVDLVGAYPTQATWFAALEGELGNLQAMPPEKAQKTFSETVLKLEVRNFQRVAAAEPLRLKNWKAECNRVAARTYASTPWQEADVLTMTNTNVDVAVARRLRIERPVPLQTPRSCPCGHNQGVPGADVMGDHEEATCSKNAGLRTTAHDNLADTLMLFLRAAGFRNLKREVLAWDDISTDGRHRRVPDIICDAPGAGGRYIIDLRIAWKLSNAAGGARYERTGDLARAGAKDKWRRWKKAVENHRDFANGATFVPFSMEIGGAMCAEASSFWTMCIEWAGNTRCVDRWHWSAPSFDDFWTQAIGVCLVNSRGLVAAGASERGRRRGAGYRDRWGRTSLAQLESSYTDNPM